MNLQEQHKLITELSNVLNIFKFSEGAIRPHFILTGPSGSGKSHLIETLAEKFQIDHLEINAAQLTKEGTSGNSLSKALSPLAECQGNLVLCFVDEFDKLFISGNSNSELAHESTNGVQNEFLRVLEARTASVFSDYGKYEDVSVNKVLFVFAGAFNGEENITVDSLRLFGVKTEFIGRVGLVFNTTKLSLESLIQLLENSTVLQNYLKLYPNVKKENVVPPITQFLTQAYAKNTLGIRLVNTLIHQFFINGGVLHQAEVTPVCFQTSLTLNPTVNHASEAWGSD